MLTLLTFQISTWLVLNIEERRKLPEVRKLSAINVQCKQYTLN